jgi:enterochelin esterase family protein
MDPANPRTVPGGFGPRSEVAMPGFRRWAEPDQERAIPAGTLAALSYRSTVLEEIRTFHVYLPPGYAESTDRYPVAYFQDGGDYLSLAGAQQTLDILIGRGAIRPVMAVFINPPALPGRNRRTEYAMNDSYVKFMVSELIPHIDSTYRTLARANQRLIIGASFGGLISLYAAFRHPGVFGNAASQSGFVTFAHDSLITLFHTGAHRPLRIYADIGVYETAVGDHPADEADFCAGNRRLRDVLEEHGYAPVYREFHDGHSWGRWRNELPFILRQFFPWTG